MARGMNGLWRTYRQFGEDWGKATGVLKSVLAAGPERGKQILLQAAALGDEEVEEWLEFLFPADGPPAYLLLDAGKFRTSWFRKGTWDFEKKKGESSFFQVYFGIRKEGKTLTNGRGLNVDIDTGFARVGNRTQNLRELATIPVSNRANREFRKTYDRSSGSAFWMIAGRGFGVLMDQRMTTTTAVRLFVGLERDSPYFRPVKMRPRYYQIWKVTGDKIAGHK